MCIHFKINVIICFALQLIVTVFLYFKQYFISVHMDRPHCFYSCVVLHYECAAINPFS